MTEKYIWSTLYSLAFPLWVPSPQIWAVVGRWRSGPEPEQALKRFVSSLDEQMPSLCSAMLTGRRAWLYCQGHTGSNWWAGFKSTLSNSEPESCCYAILSHHILRLDLLGGSPPTLSTMLHSSSPRARTPRPPQLRHSPACS